MLNPNSRYTELPPMNTRIVVCLVGLGMALAAGAPLATAQEVRGASEYPRIRIQGRFQPQFYIVDNKPYSDQTGPTNQIFLRRARFRFRVAIKDNLSVLLNPSFEGSPASVRIQDAYVDFRLSGRDANTFVLLRGGQFKTRFGRYENKSSTNLPSLERGAGAGQLDAASNDLFKSAGFIGRDVGIAAFFGNTSSPAHWGFGENGAGEVPKHPWGISVAVYNGQGASTSDDNNGKSVGARGTFRLLPQLDLGASVYLHDGIVGADSSFTNVAYGLEAEWGRLAAPGLWVNLETMYGQDFSAAKAWMLGMSLIAAYHIRMDEGSPLYAIEPAAQVDIGDPDTDVDSNASWLFRIGANAYLTPRTQFRLMIENQSFNQDGLPSIFGLRTGFTVSW